MASSEIEALKHPLVRDAVRALEGRVIEPSLTPAEWQTEADHLLGTAAENVKKATIAKDEAVAAGKPVIVLHAQLRAALRELEAATAFHEIIGQVNDWSRRSRSGSLFVNLPDLDVTISCNWREK